MKENLRSKRIFIWIVSHGDSFRQWGKKQLGNFTFHYQRFEGHSRPQSPRSFWPAAGIESSGLIQHRESAIHGLPVKSVKSDWLRIRNEYPAHAQKIGSGQSSRSLPQARRIVGSGEENVQERDHKIRLRISILPFTHNHNSLHLWSYSYYNLLRFEKTCSRPLQCDLFPIRELPRSFASGSHTAAAISWLCYI